jgi:CBS domain containing-hemolysin-like protein
MMALIWIAASMFFLLASGYYSGSEMGLYCVNRLRLRLRAERTRSITSILLYRMTQNPQETVLAILLGTNLANYLLTVSTAELLGGFHTIDPQRVEFYTAAVLSPMIFVFGDVVPKNWFQARANDLMLLTSRVLYVTVLIFRYTGVIWALQQMARLGARLAGQLPQDEWHGARGEVIGLLREGAAEGILTEEQARIIERVMKLSNVRVGSIMIPRRRVASIPVEAGLYTFKQTARNHNFSRMPVLARDRRTVLGVVDVLDVLLDEEGHSLEKWMREPIEIEAKDSAASALVRLQQDRRPMAIVTDPRHGFVGIVTIKDIVEAIFGRLPPW